MDAKYDIFRKLPDGQPLWMKAVEGLERAKSELEHIARMAPGEYFLYDTRSGNVISVSRTPIFPPSTQFSVDSVG